MLRPLQATLAAQGHPDLLAGLAVPDDAAVWRVAEDRALVVTVDFFTPVVDTPYDYGAIAAANSLSDVYAMGGTPFLALNLLALPPDLPPEIGTEILRGGAEKAREAGVLVVGGHTIQDKEPKYGLVALGWVHPAALMTKAGARPGDRLVLTKPLGFGCVTTAIKRAQATAEDTAEVIAWMSRLNAAASRAAVAAGVRAATDVTGFSLLGHAWEMAQASDVTLRFFWEQIPILASARQRYAPQGIFPGGAFDNLRHFAPQVTWGRDLAEHECLLLFDPQTSGGLLLAVPAARWADFEAAAQREGLTFWPVGEVLPGPPRLEVR